MTQVFVGLHQELGARVICVTTTTTNDDKNFCKLNLKSVLYVCEFGHTKQLLVGGGN